MDEIKTAGAEIVKPTHKTDRGGHPGHFKYLNIHILEIVCNPFFRVGPEDS